MKDIEYLKTETYAIYISAAVHSFPTQETGALLIDVTTLDVVGLACSEPE